MSGFLLLGPLIKIIRKIFCLRTSTSRSPPKPPRDQLATVLQIKTLFSPFWLQNNQMKRTQRFKRVGKPEKPIRPDDSFHTLEKSITIRARRESRSRSQPAVLSVSDLALSFGKYSILPPDFFQIDALELAPRLLGKLIRRDDVVLRITEVMALSSVFVSAKMLGKKKEEERKHFF